jgi:hypothetical protein
MARRTLYFFDFDGTLLTTFWKDAWEAAHGGAPWRDGAPGWFRHPDSLFAHAPGPALPAYFEALNDTGAVIVLHTGRDACMQDAVLNALSTHGATRFDELGFAGKRAVLKGKVARIAALIEKHSATRVVLYDDKPLS